MNALPKTRNGSRCLGTTIVVNLEKEVSHLHDLEITRSFSASSQTDPDDGGHDVVRGLVVNDELLAGATQWSTKHQLTSRPW